MNRTTAWLGGALLVAGIIAAVLFGNLREQREQNAQMLARVTALETARTAPAATFQQAPVVSVDEVAAPTGPPTAPSVAPASTLATGRQEESFFDLIRQTMETPEGQEYTRTMAVMSLQQQYPDLAQALGLTAEEADRLIQMLARHQTRTGVARMGAATSAEDAAARQERMRAIIAQEQAHEAELEALLGSRYRPWKEYQRAAMTRQRENVQRQQTETLRMAVSAPGRPVQDAQFEALRAALQAEEQRIRTETGGASARQQLQRLDDNHRRLIDVASAHLDPAQLEGYRRHLQQQADLSRMMISAMEATESAGTRVASPREAD